MLKSSGLCNGVDEMELHSCGRREHECLALALGRQNSISSSFATIFASEAAPTPLESALPASIARFFFFTMLCVT
jgi:hypothetical protein